MIYTDKVFVNTAKTVFAYFVEHVSTAFISGKMSYWGYKLGIYGFYHLLQSYCFFQIMLKLDARKMKHPKKMRLKLTER